LGDEFQLGDFFDFAHVQLGVGGAPLLTYVSGECARSG
jgi:hypothetical protein